MTWDEAVKLNEGEIIEVLQPDGSWIEGTVRDVVHPLMAFDYVLSYTPGYSMSPVIAGSTVIHTTIDKIRRKDVK
jgi:hypothetical protein